jgi:hypothetical protein
LFKELHNNLLKVDYSIPFDDGKHSQFIAEMGFTILDWQMVEKIS